jgi:hypothetical protein
MLYMALNLIILSLHTKIYYVPHVKSPRGSKHLIYWVYPTVIYATYVMSIQHLYQQCYSFKRTKRMWMQDSFLLLKHVIVMVLVQQRNILVGQSTYDVERNVKLNLYMFKNKTNEVYSTCPEIFKTILHFNFFSNI